MFFTSLAVAGALATTPGCRLISFSRSPALARTSEEVCVRRAGKPGEFSLRRTSTNARGVVSDSLTSTGACPGVLKQLQALEELGLPQVDLPAFGNQVEVITLDGVGYQLTAPALYGGDMSSIVVQSNIGTPLARWIDETFRALAPCWRETR